MLRFGPEMRSKLMGIRVIAAALALWFAGAGVAWADDLVVVVNSQAPVQKLTDKDIKDIFLGEKGFWGDVKIVPVGYVDGAPIQNEFLDKVVNISENVYKTYWIKRIFREGGTPPKKAASAEEALSIVSRNPGAVGFVYASQLAGATNVREVLRVRN
jgi:ABC-type phosphate transport system substrate-binding protein